MFADTDFILALVKKSDWLKKNAIKILDKEKGKIRTSVSVMVEVALICKRNGMNVEETFANAFEMIDVDEKTYEKCMKAAVYIERYNVNVFDAFHAASCENDKIISSDSVYEKLGIERIKLEKA